MLDARFVILGAVIGLAGTAAYLRDTVRGTTRPNRVTWMMWAAAPLLAFAVEVDEGVGLQALLTFTVGFSPLLVFVASFVNRQSVWRLGILDWLCGLLSAAGLAAWLITRHGTVAVVAAIASDALAGVPTLRKSWSDPGSETAAIFLCGFANAAITLLTVRHWTTAEAGFPIYIACIGGVQSILVAGRLGPRLRS